MTPAEASPAGQAASLSHCADLVRSADKDRFLSAMTARPGVRENLFALYAFNHEIAKISEVVSEPMLGQIRLQWWRDAIEECYAGTPRRHQVVQALATAIQAGNLARALFETAIDAREADLEPPAVQSLDQLTAYALGTSGSISRLAAQVTGAAEEADLLAAERIGTAWALVGLMRALPFQLRRRRCPLPLPLLKEAGISLTDLYEGRPVPGLPAAVRSVCGRAGDELSQARDRWGYAKRGLYGALSLGVLADAYLRQLRRCGYDPFDARMAQLPAWRTSSLMVRALGERF